MGGFPFRSYAVRIGRAALMAAALLVAGCNMFAGGGVSEPVAVPPEPPPPPPAPPAPPPPPAPAPGPWIAFFDYGSDDLTPEARSILDSVAQQVRSYRRGHVGVAGGTDRAEPQPGPLSLQRARAVKSYLVGKGVPARSIVVEGFGEARPLVETADGVREPQNRFAQINFSSADACPPGALAPKTGARVFRLPPPRPSSFANLPPAAFRVAGNRTTYADIDERLTAALERAGYPPRSYYSTCGGFAMATKVERLRSDGRPFAQPDRFVSMDGTYSTIEDFTLAGIIRALTTVQEGRFRVLVFLVTDQLVSFSDRAPAPAEAEQWVVRGTTDLDPAIGATRVPATFYVKALVYEFRKVGNRVEFVANGRPAMQQLRDANVRIGANP